MKGERVIRVFSPKSSDDFFLLQTTSNFYLLSLGGYSQFKTTNLNSFIEIESFQLIDKIINKVYSDNQTLYIETIEGDGISYGLTFVNTTGGLSFEIYYHDKKEFHEIKMEVINVAEYEFREI